jgi:hypothetical protein
MVPRLDERVQCLVCGRWPLVRNWPNHLLGKGRHWPAEAAAPTPADSPFRKVVDDLTGGCGCACHTGIGYNAACGHCQAAAPTPAEPLPDGSLGITVETVGPNAPLVREQSAEPLDVERLARALEGTPCGAGGSISAKAWAGNIAAEYARLSEPEGKQR